MPQLPGHHCLPGSGWGSLVEGKGNAGGVAGAGPGQGLSWTDRHLFHTTSCHDVVVLHHHQPSQVVAVGGGPAH